MYFNPLSGRELIFCNRVLFVLQWYLILGLLCCRGYQNTYSVKTLVSAVCKPVRSHDKIETQQNINESRGIRTLGHSVSAACDGAANRIAGFDDLCHK